MPSCRANLFSGAIKGFWLTQTEQNHGYSILGILRVTWCRVYNRLKLLKCSSTADPKFDVNKLQKISLVNVKRYFTRWINEAPIAMSGLKKFFKKKSPSAKNTLSTEDLSDAASIASGYSISKDKDLPKLHKAVLSGDLSKVKQLVKKGDINQLDRENR